MKHWVMLLGGLTAVASARADDRPLVHLHEGGFGAAREWDLRLERDGRVVEERSNIDAKNDKGLHSETVIRTVPTSQLGSLVARASELAAPLPEYVDEDNVIVVDEETRSIRIMSGGGEKFYGWAGYGRKQASASSRKFMRTWQSLAALLRDHPGARRNQKP